MDIDCAQSAASRTNGVWMFLSEFSGAGPSMFEFLFYIKDLPLDLSRGSVARRLRIPFGARSLLPKRHYDNKNYLQI
ncbi:hypothetical protein ABMY26_03235 [Azospirillum sp. HJ39]|uniref:hypothetical protein n=1 Tax=Azospirillum sp. HJ39 TaxID=3159496 RepID=UPI003555E926